jgi:4-amino-4-deoxy-L-arabinose transferase-like glycosyltransferase
MTVPGPHAGRWTLPALAVGLLTAAGAALRVVVAGQPLFADELSTYWIVTAHGLGGVVSTVHTDAEITPPLSFVLSWLTAQAGHAPELVRAPSLLAGVASIPLVYLLGLRTVGRPAALVAAGLTAFSPFMVYYAAEARAYAPMMALVVLSTLAMLRAAETGSLRWWVVYAAASCAAVYTHYTCVFVLGAQLAWLLWSHPEARRAAILANVGAVAAFLPWATGLANDLTSPTSKILSALSPFTPHDVRLALEHWAIGYPYTWVARLPELPGAPALVLLGLALALGGAGVARPAAARRGARRRRAARDPQLVLVVLLAASAPVGEALVSAVGTNLFGVRNLAPSWPGLALLLAVAVTAAGPRLRYAAGALAVAAFALGAVKLLEQRYQRPDYRAAARFVDRTAAPGDVVIDGTAVLSPGPLSGLDAALARPHPLFRAGAPETRDHPFGFLDPVVSLPEAAPRAVAAARGGRIFLVSTAFPRRIAGLEDRTEPVRSRLPAPYRLVETRRYPGIAETVVEVYAAAGTPE